MSQRIRRWFEDSAETKLKFVAEHADRIQLLANLLAETFRKGNKVLFFGNGGSAMDASHLAAEFVGRYRRERAPLAALSLSADQAKLTCIANDYGYDHVFSRQVEGLGRPGDVLALFTTSGDAANLEKALDAARAKGIKVLCLLGKTGGRLKGKGDWEIWVQSSRTERIQEAHQLILHAILEAVERAFPPP